MKTILPIILLFAGLCCAEAQNWTWSEDQLSYARMGLSAAVLDDSIFFSGGRTDETSSFLNIIDIYDVGDSVWDIAGPGTSGQWLTNAVSANGMVFFAGGNNFGAANWHFFTEISVFTKATGEWSIIYLSEPRGFLGAVSLGNKVFFAGGGDETGTIYDVIDIYDTESGIWSIDTLSVPRQWMGTAVAGGKVFFAGGNTIAGGNEVTHVIDIYDIGTGNWSIDSLSEPRALTAAVSYGGKVYFAGGARSNNTSCEVIDIYNVANETWEDPIYLSSARVVTALNVKNALIFTGICDNVVLNQGLYQNRNGIVDIYYPDTDQWDYSAPDLNPARFFYAYASYNNKAYYAGGWTAFDGATDIVNILEYPQCFPEGITFTSQAEINNFQTNYPYCPEINGDVEISGNDITNLDSLYFVTAIGGDLSIINCDMLTSITGFAGITSINGSLEIANNAILASLSGLENIESESIIDLSIWGNDALSDCDIWNICQYLINPGGTAVIEDNAPECNSIEEVQEHCLTEIGEISTADKLNIFPNPLGPNVIITYNLQQSSFVKLKIHDLSGKGMITIINEIQPQGDQRIDFNTAGLPAGIYFCILKTNEEIQTKKLIKL